MQALCFVFVVTLQKDMVRAFGADGFVPLPRVSSNIKVKNLSRFSVAAIIL